MNKAAAEMVKLAIEDIDQDNEVDVLVEGLSWQRVERISHDAENGTVTVTLPNEGHITCADGRLVAVRAKERWSPSGI